MERKIPCACGCDVFVRLSERSNTLRYFVAGHGPTSGAIAPRWEDFGERQMSLQLEPCLSADPLEWTDEPTLKIWPPREDLPELRDLERLFGTSDGFEECE